MVVAIRDGSFSEAKFFPQEEGVPCALHLGQARDLLKLPLVFKDEGVSTWPPTMQVFFATDIRGAGVQDPSLSSL